MPARLRLGTARTMGVAAGVAASALAVSLISSGSTPVRASSAGGILAAAPVRGFVIPRPVPLADASEVTRWASVLRSVVARSAPNERARAVAEVSARTPEGTTNLLVADAAQYRAGALWERVQLAVLPNGTEGWVPRSALGAWTFVDTRLVVDRRTLRATLLRDGRPIFETAIGVGAPGTPTPPGRFYVRDRLSGFSNPMYGVLAFGISARSATLTDWPAGGFIGIHGTDQPELIPGRVSHGCVRLTNRSIETLGKLMPVGTPVIVT